ncbi:MAG: ribosome maturation factor RimM [Microcoleaceae cyanobacterium]
MSEWIEIGTIVSAQGLDGELRVYPNSDFPERFLLPGQRWMAAPGQTEPQSVELLGGRLIPGKGLYVIELANIETRDQAELLRDYRLLVPDSDRPPLEEDEFLVRDLIDLNVIIQATGECIGQVISIIPAGNDLLEVKLNTPENEEIKSEIIDPSLENNSTRTRRKKRIKKPLPPKPKTVLIPFVKEIVPVVDFEKGQVEITPPDGLIE